MSSQPAKTQFVPSRGRRLAGQLRAARDALYREHIFEVAERIFAEAGYENAKMQEVAAAAGISLGTLYSAFDGKAGLYRAILITRGQQMFERVQQATKQLTHEAESLPKLLRLMEAHLRFFMEHPQYLKMQLLEGHIWYDAAARPSREEQELWNQGLTLLKSVFEWGSRANLFVPADPADQARMLLALQQTRLANWVLGGMRQPHDEVIAAVQADFVRMFCRPAVAARFLAPTGARLMSAAG